MLLVKRPDRNALLAVLSGLLEGRYSRDEVLAWQRAVVADFDEPGLSVADGFWYFESLGALTIPISLSDGEEFFIRDRDIREYLLDLQRVDAGTSYEGVTRVRQHQTDPHQVRWPLLMFEHSDAGKLERLGLQPVRGIFDAHRDLVEHTHLFFNGDLYLVVRQYDDQAHQLMVLGSNRDEAQLRALLSILGFFDGP